MDLLIRGSYTVVTKLSNEIIELIKSVCNLGLITTSNFDVNRICSEVSKQQKSAAEKWIP